MPRVRAAPGSQATTAKNAATRQALKETTNTARARGPVYEDDGETEDLIKDAKPKRGRPKKVARQDSDELVMAGGLGMASEETAQQTSDVLTTTDELAKSDVAPGPIAKPNRRPPRTIRKVAPSQGQSKILEGLKERMNATAQGQRAKPKPSAAAVAAESSDPLPAAASVASKSQPAVAENSDLDLSLTPPAPGKLDSVQRRRSSMAQPGSVLKAHTPAVENSMLALKNFKRRPRQPSMLEMVKQKMGSRRGSMVNATNVTIDDNAVDDESVFDLGLSDDDEEDFAPEAEGTPLHVSKKRMSTLSNTQQTSKVLSNPVSSSAGIAQKKRKSDALDVSSGSLSALRAKRQRNDQDISSGSLAALRARRHAADSEVSHTQDALEEDEVMIRSSTERAETPQAPITSDVQVINSPSSSTPPTEPSSSHLRDFGKNREDDEYAIPSTERQAGTEAEPEDEADLIPNGTMADPISSPLTLSDDVLPDPATQQVSPSPVKKPRTKSKPLKTTALQSLLPKRRKPLQPRQRKSQYDIESSDLEDEPLETSHLDDDEDELGDRVRRQTKKAPVKSKKSTTAAKGKPSKTAAKKVGAKKITKTYGRKATASDKENDGFESLDEAEESTLPEISYSMENIAKSKEIQAAKAKFADIDKWDMEFESVDVDEHRSSSFGWR